MFNSNDFRREIENLKAFKEQREIELERLVKLANTGEVENDNLSNLVHYYKVAIADSENAIKQLDKLVTLYYWQEEFNIYCSYTMSLFSK